MWVEFVKHGCTLVAFFKHPPMKQITILFFFALTLTMSGFSQAPQGFPYQAVARDNGGNLIANHNISLRFSILDGSNVGTTVYQETQTATTNSLGLFNLNIGQGIVVSGTFNAINWANGAKFIKVELDANGGNAFVLMGTSQLMSVPYALHSGSSIHSTGPVIDPGHPTTNSWTQKANAGNNVRSMGVGFSIGQLGYVGIGTSASGLIALDDFWEYNAGNNTWTQKANFPAGGRKGAVGFSIGNKGYVGTGETVTALGGYVNYDLWEYDPALNSWTQKTNLTGSARKFATGFSIGNKGYIGLGTDGGSDLTDFWEYDPATDSWAQKANYNGNGKRFVASFATGSKGYIGLGTDINGNYYNDWNEYNPTTNAWTGKATFPAAGRHSTAGFAMNNKGYVGTGYDGANYLNEFWEYNPATDAWTTKATYSGNARKNAVGFSIGNKGYIGTGGDILERNDIWEYMDDNVSGTAYSSAPDLGSNNLVTDGAWTLYNNQVYNSNSGNVGVGTSTPANKFSVVGNVDFDGNVGVGTTTPTNKLSVVGNADFDGKVGIGTSTATNKFSVVGNADISGNLGIGTNIPTNKLSVVGNVDINGNVGIGTNTPGRKLTIKKNGIGVSQESNDGSVQVGLYAYDGGDAYIQTHSNHNLNFATSNGSAQMTLLTNGNLGIGNMQPNGSLQFNNIFKNRKIVLLEDANNDNQFYGLGINASAMRYQVGSTSASHVFYAGTGTSSSDELMRINGNGNVGIGNVQPNGSLQFNNSAKNRKVVLYEDANNDNQFYGLGINASAMRYQVGNSGASHVFYAGNGASSSTELMRINGNGKVGIGTNNPFCQLTVKVPVQNISDGIAITDGVLNVQLGTDNYSGFVGTSSGHPFRIVANSISSFFISTTGQVGIETFNPTASLSVNGTANKVGGGSWAVFSDRRLKKNIATYYDGLATLLKINPIKYHYNEILECDTTTEFIGVVAQEIKEIAPYMVRTVKFKDTDYLEVDNSAMTYMLINATKEMNSKYEVLNTKYEEQKKQNSYLQKQIDELKALIKK